MSETSVNSTIALPRCPLSPRRCWPFSVGIVLLLFPLLHSHNGRSTQGHGMGNPRIVPRGLEDLAGGDYDIDLWAALGAGPSNTIDFAAIRTLTVAAGRDGREGADILRGELRRLLHAPIVLGLLVILRAILHAGAGGMGDGEGGIEHPSKIHCS